jgi:very-short-patch-repair endonuclease
MRGPQPKLLGKVRRLRRSATDAETRLWFQLRDRRLAGFKFVRQEPIGPYVVDFVCRDRKLTVEADGGQHAESIHDTNRDAFLRREGYRVIRFWNIDVLRNREGVLMTILDALDHKWT